ncbi:quinone-dependent dihydroorotate dehydrogenase [Thermocoleostomius sinensis]|uniref:Dihydroorotate dehydrogenase (quinone) n=1 Tax=Thermocoleostomius sinensis A174 TaxID=2016057 RepID=A0A9E9C9N9_9CYAN|nr:quinone-dependent dihydroorotate dehydrogenase [Thermocoleostomius sinensis]WAL61833.1 quinone-dependent dihydroorotate dehydrogenase [Thermocoleostomius sinensis A174]
MDIYTALIRPLLFSVINADAEQLHQQTMQWLSGLDTAQPLLLVRLLRQQIHRSCSFTHPALTQTLWGCQFSNPVGLAAGFDKDGLAAGVWSDFGFGFAELGTVTFHPQPGNPKPRLFRLPIDRAALNRMGFNNQGAAALATRLQALRDRTGTESTTDSIAPHPSIPLGINLGKSKITPLEAAVEDYVGSFRLLKSLGDYFVINVSSPNTPGLRSLQAVEQLEPILSGLQQENQNQKPLLIKIAPDLDWEDIAAIVHLTQTYHLAGIIATNTTIRRDRLKTQIIAATGQPVTAEAGGISGAPVRQRSTEVIRFIYQQTQGGLPIVGVGGVFTADDAWEKIIAGASLVQVYTGWIYEGPWMVKRILQGLVRKLEEHKLNQITDAVGMNYESRVS